MFHLLKLREAGNKNSKGDQRKTDQKENTKEKSTSAEEDKHKNAADSDK